MIELVDTLVVGHGVRGLSRVWNQLKRRSRVAALFPSAASCERLASAVAVEISEEWVAGCIYLNMDVND